MHQQKLVAIRDASASTGFLSLVLFYPHHFFIFFLLSFENISYVIARLLRITEYIEIIIDRHYCNFYQFHFYY